MPEENKPLLVNNDTLCFMDSSNNNNIDSFKVTVYNFYQSDEGSSAESITLNYKYINKNNTSKSFFTLQSVSFPVVDFESFPYLKYPNSLQTNVNILGVIYPAVYELKSYKDYPDTIPNAIYYTYKYGVVRYDYADGRKYELMSETVAK